MRTAKPFPLLVALLMLLVGGCGVDTLIEDQGSSAVSPPAQADNAAVAVTPESAEPPPAFLTIDGREQPAGITSYCWQQADGAAICADGLGVTTVALPLLAASTFLAEFELLLDAEPERVTLSAFPATPVATTATRSDEWRYWGSTPGSHFTLPPNRSPAIELTLEPGLYALSLFVSWPAYGDVSYGFLIDVEGAMYQDAAAFAEDQGLPLDEALRRLRFQETVGEIQPLLSADLPDAYGGLWIEHQPAYRIVIALTEGSFETIRPYVAGYEWADFVEVRLVDHTLQTLIADQGIASQAANALRVPAVTAVDVAGNRVEIMVGNPGLFRHDLMQAGIDLPASVVVVAANPDGPLPETNRGLLLEAVTPDDRAIYLPVKPPGGIHMAALMEGTLVEDEGCLRMADDHAASSWLVIWPFGSDIRVADNRIEVVNEEGVPVARVGDRLRAGGGAVENGEGLSVVDEQIPGMPIEGCPGPYWVAAPLESLVDQAVPDIYFEPFSAGGEILAWFVSQSRPSPETESLSGHLMLDTQGCLRLEELLLILPPETYLREDPLRIVNRDLEEIARVGGELRVTGAEKTAAGYRRFADRVQCPGPYWGVNQILPVE